MFEKPIEVSDVDIAFGGNMKNLLPEMADIPEEFFSSNNEFVEFQNNWFFKGLDKVPKAKDGIDIKKAIRHLSAIQGSFEPQHEQKQAGVAYLASRWLEL